METALSPTSLPPRTSRKALVNYVLHLADSALILGHRNSEWTGHGPILEQDIALSNISLDLIGQARLFYQLAARLLNEGIQADEKPESEDSLAFSRNDRQYRNLLITELPNGDWGKTILKQFFFSSHQLVLLQHLKNSSFSPLADIAEKAFKEVTYHYKWSAEWVIRLGDGTPESHQRMQDALKDLWPYTGELILISEFEQELQQAGLIPNSDSTASVWKQKVEAVLREASLSFGESPDQSWMKSGGKEGLHTEHLGFLLAEMQYMQRMYPNCEW